MLVILKWRCILWCIAWTNCLLNLWTSIGAFSWQSHILHQTRHSLKKSSNTAKKICCKIILYMWNKNSCGLNYTYLFKRNIMNLRWHVVYIHMHSWRSHFATLTFFCWNILHFSAKNQKLNHWSKNPIKHSLKLNLHINQYKAFLCASPARLSTRIEVKVNYAKEYETSDIVLGNTIWQLLDINQVFMAQIIT